MRTPGDFHHTSCQLVDFLFWLDVIGHNNARSLQVTILRRVGMLFNYGQWLNSADNDCAMIPFSTGNQRARAVAGEFKDAVARMGAAGDLFKSGRHAVEVLRRFRLAKGIKAFKSANTWADSTCARYLAGCFREI